MCSGTGKSQGKSQLSLEYGALGGAELNGGAEGFKQPIVGYNHVAVYSVILISSKQSKVAK